jgi:hypothetical protein
MVKEDGLSSNIDPSPPVDEPAQDLNLAEI